MTPLVLASWKRRMLPGLYGITLFVGLSVAIWTGALAQLDPKILLALRTPGHLATPLGPAWLAETGRDITGMGSNAVMGLIVLTASGGCLLAARWRQASALFIAFAAAEIGCAALKSIAQRPRPGLVPDAPMVFTTSFPSSHAMVSAATLLTLAAVTADLTVNPRVRRFGFAMACTGTALIGLSRIYLGVHWPSDVAAGWIAGFLCFWITRTGIGLWSPKKHPGSWPSEGD